MRIAVLSLCFFVVLIANVYARNISLEDYRSHIGQSYYLRLINGDVLSGVLVDVFDDEEHGEAVKLKTAIGTATIYAEQIAELTPMDEVYPHAHRIFIMPTADPIGNNHFVGLYELFFLYGGVGIADIVSITAGRTIVPLIPSSDQISTVNIKATLYREDNKTMPGHISFALGANLAWLNAPNQLLNMYGVATFTGARARISGVLFYKATGEDVITLNGGTIGSTLLNYERGSVGIGVGLDTKLTDGRYDIHVIGELWNHNIARPTNTAVMLGFRLWNTTFSADFGLTFFTAPAVVPVANFVWTPF
jgi:hypothetical protein